MTINALPKQNCTGCGLCYNLCPVSAIDMLPDKEGFLYPVIDEKKCIACGLCASKCPQLTKKKKVEDGNICFAIQCHDNTRSQCSSGGVFKALAHTILKRGGYVCGAAFDESQTHLRHTIISREADLPSLLTSKYLQSETNSCYNLIRNLLNKQKPLLFCGCPCQVDALKTYLDKDYPNLLTVDLLCHGVPSPLAYQKFLEEMNPEGKRITKVNFRAKDNGWGTLIRIDFSDHTVKYSLPQGDYMRAFLSGMNMRPACYSCQYANEKRVGDITLGDYWGVKSQWNDGKGTSLVIAHTLKGTSALQAISDRTTLMAPISYEEMHETCKKVNGALIKPTPEHEMRKSFFYHLSKDGFHTALRYANKCIMDVGILGWWIHTSESNYGSTLTAYALERYCASLGLSTAFISPPNFDRDTAGRFNKQYNYRMTAKYSYKDMWKNNQYFKTYIVGSDVLWYYDAMMASAKYNFMLDFAGEKNRKISYSTSFGNPKYFFPENAIPYAKTLLKRFDAVSSREIEGVRILKEKFDIDATQVVDPVFLCERSVWNKLSQNAMRKTPDSFVFAYFLDPNEEKIKAFKAIAALMKAKMICATDRQYKPKEKAEMLKTCGVMPDMSLEEIIYHMMHANYILTDSFHGTCFSLIFRRNFYALPNYQRDTTRFETLSNIFDISDRMISDLSVIYNKKQLTVVDYKKVEPRIEYHTKRSQDWLKSALLIED